MPWRALGSLSPPVLAARTAISFARTSRSRPAVSAASAVSSQPCASESERSRCDAAVELLAQVHRDRGRVGIVRCARRAAGRWSSATGCPAGCGARGSGRARSSAPSSNWSRASARLLRGTSWAAHRPTTPVLWIKVFSISSTTVSTRADASNARCDAVRFGHLLVDADRTDRVDLGADGVGDLLLDVGASRRGAGLDREVGDQRLVLRVGAGGARREGGDAPVPARRRAARVHRRRTRCAGGDVLRLAEHVGRQADRRGGHVGRVEEVAAGGAGLVVPGGVDRVDRSRPACWRRRRAARGTAGTMSVIVAVSVAALPDGAATAAPSDAQRSAPAVPSIWNES